MTKGTTMTKNIVGNVDKQPWTEAFEKRSTEGFEAALVLDVVLNASSRNSRPNSAEGSKARSTGVTSTACPINWKRNYKDESDSIRAVW
jgi:hypothetical protein